MRAVLSRHRREMDALLGDPAARTDWEAIRERHLRWIGFFQHERLIHLLVTLCVGLAALAAALAIVLAPPGGAWAAPWIAALEFLLLALLVPYLRHYYVLENGVQDLYRISDRVAERMAADGRRSPEAGG